MKRLLLTVLLLLTSSVGAAQDLEWWYELATKEGHAAAQGNLGLTHYLGIGAGGGQDYAEAVKWYRLPDQQASRLMTVGI